MLDFLKNPIIKRLLGVAVRRGLDALGTLLIARGLATDVEWTTLAASLTPILVSLLWSLYEKAQADKKLEVALDLPAGATKADVAAVLREQAARSRE